jgi:Family of unknown function (DUF6209)
MSYGTARAASFFSLLLVAACSGAPAGEDAAQSSAASVATAEAQLSFHADFTTTASGPFTAGQKLRVAYDVARSTACRGDLNGHPGWSVTGYYRLNGGAVGTFEAGGFSPSGGTQPPVFDLPTPGDLEIWFQTTSVWGCTSYDSNYGKNYHFAVGASNRAPGWIGNAAAVVSRATCNGGPCDADRRPLDGGFLFDTWARQRAAITSGYFDVWKQGTTDWDNPNLWRDLDVELFTRVGDAGSFAMTYVSFDHRDGNNARYAFSLRTLDPVGGLDGGALTDKSQCPAFPLPLDPSGQYVQVDLQFYVTVNGTELRPAAGGVFHGTYQNYKGLYAVCF